MALNTIGHHIRYLRIENYNMRGDLHTLVVNNSHWTSGITENNEEIQDIFIYRRKITIALFTLFDFYGNLKGSSAPFEQIIHMYNILGIGKAAYHLPRQERNQTVLCCPDHGQWSPTHIYRVTVNVHRKQ